MSPLIYFKNNAVDAGLCAEKDMPQLPFDFSRFRSARASARVRLKGVHRLFEPIVPRLCLKISVLAI
jgi:hypothetical protein